MSFQTPVEADCGRSEHWNDFYSKKVATLASVLDESQPFDIIYSRFEEDVPRSLTLWMHSGQVESRREGPLRPGSPVGAFERPLSPATLSFSAGGFGDQVLKESLLDTAGRQIFRVPLYAQPPGLRRRLHSLNHPGRVDSADPKSLSQTSYGLVVKTVDPQRATAQDPL